MNIFKKVIVMASILVVMYFAVSWYLLNGRLTYYTSFNKETIIESKQANLFVTDNLEIKSNNDSNNSLISRFKFWTNKRYEIKYYGILFYWTFTDPEWRYLCMNNKLEVSNDYLFRRKLIINNDTTNYVRKFGGQEACCNRISCKVGDLVKIEYNHLASDTVFETLTIRIE